jgi:hypothetical protein
MSSSLRRNHFIGSTMGSEEEAAIIPMNTHLFARLPYLFYTRLKFSTGGKQAAFE